MTSTTSASTMTPPADWVSVARELGPGFAARAAALDANDSFAADNFRELKERRVFSAGVPVELGGGGALHSELCAMLRELGRYCGSTALALSMHTHLVSTSAWVWRHGGPSAPLLERIAREELVLVTSTAHDLIESSGSAERVDGGFRISARKRFVSGSPAGDLFVTSAVYDDPEGEPTVLQFSIPLQTAGVSILDNWRTMGMRATGSNDIVLDGVFVPDAAIGSRRSRSEWPAMFNVVAAIAPALIMSVYLGVAEAARELALKQAAGRREEPNLWYLAGEMENALVTARLAVQGLVDLCSDYAFEPSIHVVNDAMMRKTVAAQALTRTVEKALEVAGGGGFFRPLGLERMLRDIHAAQFHPFQEKPQQRFAGRMALGLEAMG